MNRIQFTIAVFVGLPVVASPSSSLDLRELIQLAVNNNPSLQEARLNETIAELTLQNRSAAFLPSLDFTSSHGILKEHPATNSDPWSSQLGITLTENLYDNGISHTNLKSAKLQRELAKLQWLKARDKISLDVTKAYHQYSLNSLLLEVAKLQLETLKSQFDIVSSQHRQGLKTRMDYLRLKSQVRRAEMSAVEAKTTAEKAAGELTQWLGHETPFPAPLNKPPQVSFPDRTLTLEQTFDARIAALQNKINFQSVDLEQRRQTPQLNLLASASYNNSNYLGASDPFSTNQNYGLGIALMLNYNILDWGLRERNIAIADASRLVQKSRFDQGLLTLRSEMQSFKASLSEYLANQKTSEELVFMENEAYQVIKRDFASGSVKYLDLITSLDNLQRARIQQLTIAFAIANALSQFHYYEGTLYETATTP